MLYVLPFCLFFLFAGGIPGPIAFGSVIDLSCLMWQDKCGEQGSCYLYHNSAMSQYTLVAGILYKVLMIHRRTGCLTDFFHSQMSFNRLSFYSGFFFLNEI